jgi:hypothetical protein
VRAIGLHSTQLRDMRKLKPDNLLVAYAGVVIRAGTDADLQIGERVYGLCPGMINTFLTCNSQLFYRIPSGLTFEKIC